MATTTIDTYDGNANLIGSRTVEVPPEETNRDTLRARMEAALGANADYLAITGPSNAQVVAQVRLLTRECNALLRMALGRLEDTAGT